VFAFWEIRKAERFDQWERQWQQVRPPNLPIPEDLLPGPVERREAQLLALRESVLETNLSQLRTDMLSNGHSHEASFHRTIAFVLTLAGMLGSALMGAIWRAGRDLRECRAQIRRLEEELAKRERRPPGDWCSGASLERHLK